MALNPTPSTDEAELLADPTLAADFGLLYRKMLAYKSIGNVREDKVLELFQSTEEREGCTFKPKIDPKSRKMEESRQMSLSSAGEYVPRHEALHGHSAELLKKLEIERISLEEEEMAACSFAPRIGKQRASQGSDDAPAYIRLHSSAVKKQLEGGSSQAKTSEELQSEACTFKPELHPYHPKKHVPFPAGYIQAVERVRKVVDEREERKESDASGAMKQSALNKAVKPFTFQTEKRTERKQPLLYMDVNIGPGRTGRIGLHEDDDPSQLAGNFARTYQLDATMRCRLQELIEKYMAAVLPGANNAADLSALSDNAADGSPVESPAAALSRAIASVHAEH